MDIKQIVTKYFIENEGYEASELDNLDTIETGVEFSIGPGEYMVMTDDEAQALAYDNIEHSLWAFTPSFTGSYTGLPDLVFEALAEKYHEANEAIYDILEATGGFTEFADTAMREDGRGHYISGYDGDEIELGDDLYLYRLN